jgi:hypothetical protein
MTGLATGCRPVLSMAVATAAEPRAAATFVERAGAPPLSETCGSKGKALEIEPPRGYSERPAATALPGFAALAPAYEIVRDRRRSERRPAHAGGWRR